MCSLKWFRLSSKMESTWHWIVSSQCTRLAVSHA